MNITQFQNVEWIILCKLISILLFIEHGRKNKILFCSFGKNMRKMGKISNVLNRSCRVMTYCYQSFLKGINKREKFFNYLVRAKFFFFLFWIQEWKSNKEEENIKLDELKTIFLSFLLWDENIFLAIIEFHKKYDKNTKYIQKIKHKSNINTKHQIFNNDEIFFFCLFVT